MKKLIATGMLLLVTVAGMHAQQTRPYETGDMLVGGAVAFSPLGLGSDWGEFNYSNKTQGINHDAKLGNPGWGGELQGLYFVAPWLAAGLSVDMNIFTPDVASGVEMEVSTRMSNYLAVARLYANPSDLYKVYLSLGAGLAHTSVTINMEPKAHFRYTGFSGYIGVGVERPVGEHWALALETRYNFNRFHDHEVSAHGDYITLYARANYISVLLRAGYRF